MPVHSHWGSQKHGNCTRRFSLSFQHENTDVFYYSKQQKANLYETNKKLSESTSNIARLQEKKDKVFTISYVPQWCLIRLCEYQRSHKCQLKDQ